MATNAYCSHDTKKTKKQKQQFNDSGLTTSRHTVTFNSQQV